MKAKKKQKVEKKLQIADLKITSESSFLQNQEFWLFKKSPIK